MATLKAVTESHPQTRERVPLTGQVRQDADPLPAQTVRQQKSWSHFIAGGIGGMTAAIVTAPLDVVKTRLQSDFYRERVISRAPVKPSTSFIYSTYGHFRETLQILAAIPRIEGYRALFKGLGPTLTGVVPASAIKFYTYGNAKQIISKTFNNGNEAAWVHLTAAATAGFTVGTVTNPLWVVKTRLQIDRDQRVAGDSVQRRYRNSLDCARQIVRQEGVRGLYRGLTASYIGVSESTLHWVLYEQGKMWLARREARMAADGVVQDKTSLWGQLKEAGSKVGVAGSTKLLATCITYPHEVLRTRLRQAPGVDGKLKYTGLVQCFRTVLKEEGAVAFYGGLTAHLLRTVPSTAIMFGMYEGMVVGHGCGVLRWLEGGLLRYNFGPKNLHRTHLSGSVYKYIKLSGSKGKALSESDNVKVESLHSTSTVEPDERCQVAKYMIEHSRSYLMSDLMKSKWRK